MKVNGSSKIFYEMQKDLEINDKFVTESDDNLMKNFELSSYWETIGMEIKDQSTKNEYIRLFTNFKNLLTKMTEKDYKKRPNLDTAANYLLDLHMLSKILIPDPFEHTPKAKLSKEDHDNDFSSVLAMNNFDLEKGSGWNHRLI